MTNWFDPTPTPRPQPVEPAGYDLLRQMLMQKVFGLEANPYGGDPGFSTGLNTNVPAFTGDFPTATTSGGQNSYNPATAFNPAYSRLGGVRTPRALDLRAVGASSGTNTFGNRGGGGSESRGWRNRTDASLLRPGSRIPLAPSFQPMGTQPMEGDQTLLDMLSAAPRRHFDAITGVGGGSGTFMPSNGIGDWVNFFGPGHQMMWENTKTGQRATSPLNAGGGSNIPMSSTGTPGVPQADIVPLDQATGLPDFSKVGAIGSQNYYNPNVHNSDQVMRAAHAGRYAGFGVPGGDKPIAAPKPWVQTAHGYERGGTPGTPLPFMRYNPLDQNPGRPNDLNRSSHGRPSLVDHSRMTTAVPPIPSGTQPTPHFDAAYEPWKTPVGGSRPAPPATTPFTGLAAGNPDGGDPNAGTSSFPWTQRWSGGFQAPMSDTEKGALGGINNMAGNNFGLGESQDYLKQLMSGSWLSPNNPYFDQIEKSGTTLKNTQDQRALQELQSRAGGAGNALSGGLMQQESDYMRNSNASFDQMMAQLRANQYAQERGYMNQAPGMQNSLTNTALGGIGQQMNMGAIPRQIQTGEMQGQYADWLRQIQAMQDQYRYPDQLAMSLLGGGGYKNVYQPTTGASGNSQLISILMQLLGGTSGSNVDYGQLINSIFGGSQDAHEIHMDAAPAGASSYQDKNYYLSALQKEQEAAKQAAKPVANTGANTALGITGLLAALIKLMTQKRGKTTAAGGAPPQGTGSQGAAGESLWERWKRNHGDPFAPKGPATPDTPFTGIPTEQTAYGSNNPNEQGPYLPETGMDFPTEQTAYGTNNSNMEGPYMPSDQTAWGSDNPDMQGPYMPIDGGSDYPDYSGG